MIKRCLILLSLSLFLVISAGCGSNKNASPHDLHATQPETVAPASSTPNNEAKYSLDASAYKENDEYFLKISTNLKLSSEHYEGSPVDGEGHIHFYLNGRLLGPIKATSPYPLLGLQKGKNTIKLVLAENDHTESYGVSKELSIEKTD